MLDKILLVTIFLYSHLAYGQIFLPKLPQNEKELDQVIDTFNKVTIPQVTTLRRCAEMLDSLSYQFGQLLPLIVSPHLYPGETEALSLLDEHISLQKESAQIMNELEKMSETFVTPQENLELAVEKQKKLEQAFQNLDQKAVRLAEKESAFLIYLGDLLVKFRQLLAEDSSYFSFIQQPFCMKNTKFQQVNNKIFEKTILFSGLVSKIWNSSKQAHEKRALLTKFVREYLNYSTRNEAVILLKKESASLKSQLLADLYLQQITSNISGRSLFGEIDYQSGIANKALTLYNKYHQYERTLRLLAINTAIIEDLENQLKALKSLVPDMAYAEYWLRLVQIAQEAKDFSDTLIKGGWQLQLHKQVMLNEKRLQIIQKYNPECKALVEKHLKLASQALDIDTYRLAENAYADVIDLCKGVTQ